MVHSIKASVLGKAGPKHVWVQSCPTRPYCWAVAAVVAAAAVVAVAVAVAAVVVAAAVAVAVAAVVVA